MAGYKNKYKLWVATRDQLEKVMIKQKFLEKTQPIDDRFAAHCVHADLYCDYVDLVNNLGQIYHRTFQVQKRALLAKLLEAATTRLCEIRNQLKEIELSEFIYIDRILKQRKLSYNCVQIKRPEFFPYIRKKEIYELLKKPRPAREIKHTEEEETQTKAKQKFFYGINQQKIPATSEKQKLTNAIVLIQTHERLRTKTIWRTNIKSNPAIYAPTLDSSQTKQRYSFSHKAEQDMLIPIKKTIFEENYYKRSAGQREFEFYSKKKLSPTNPLKVDEAESDHSESDFESSLREKNIELQSNADQLKKESVTMLEQETISLNPTQVRNLAARRIQNTWKIYLARRLFGKRLEDRALTYGAATVKRPLKNPLLDLFEKSYEIETIQDQYKQDFVNEVQNESTRILLKHKAGIMEDTADHVRYWIKNFYEVTDELPPFPPATKGGTILVLEEKTQTPKEFNLDKGKTKEKLQANVKKIKEAKKVERKNMKNKAKADEKKKKQFMTKIARQGKVYYDFQKFFDKNRATNILWAALHEIKKKWKHEVDEESNRHEVPFFEWIKEEKFAEVHVEIRKIVDQRMRMEYETLRAALAVDRNRPYKPRKDPKEKRAKRSKKEREEPDFTAHLTHDQIYNDMMDMGLIRIYKKRCFEQFFGDIHYCAYELKNYFQLEVHPSLLEMRYVLQEWILGMGPLKLPKCKSVLIIGPPQTGKMQLCEVFASEIDAVIIDLSIDVVAKYKDDINMLLHLIRKMSRILQPTILFLKNIHRTFWKKVPSEYDSMNPLLMSNYMQKIVNAIKDEDKIMVIATSDEPWCASSKMRKVFEKIILMPRIDYSSAYILWKNLVLQQPGIPRDLEISPLAWVCSNYTSGQIAENVSKTLNIGRRIQLQRKPLKFEEFIETFINMNLFPNENSYDKFYKWYRKANKLAKKRNQVMRILTKGKK